MTTLMENGQPAARLLARLRSAFSEVGFAGAGRCAFSGQGLLVRDW